MVSFEQIRDILFPDSNLKTEFLITLGKPGNLDQFDTEFRDFISHAPERSLQIQLAPYLRAAAIHSLRTGTTAEMLNIRTEYDLVLNPNGGPLDGQSEEDAAHDVASFEQFLAVQSEDKIHASDLEAIALGQLLQLNVLSTTITNGVTSPNSAIIFDAGLDETQCIHFYCEDNAHWFIYEKTLRPNGEMSYDAYYRTIPDGNCLYNGFAQWIQIFHRLRAEDSLVQEDSFLQSDAVVSQETLLQKYQTGERISYKDLITSRIHIANERDHQIAVALALEEAESTGASLLLSIDNTDEINASNYARYLPTVYETLDKVIRRKGLQKYSEFKRLLENMKTIKNAILDAKATEKGVVFCNILILIVKRMQSFSGDQASTSRQEIEDTLNKKCDQWLSLEGQNDVVLVGSILDVLSRTISPAPIIPKEVKTILYSRVVPPTTDYLSPMLRLLAIGLMVAGIIALISSVLCLLLSNALILAFGPALITSACSKLLISAGGVVGIALPSSPLGMAVLEGAASTLIAGCGFMLFNATNTQADSSLPTSAAEKSI